MKIIDCFTFYNELDMLKFRLEYLKDVVDAFVLVEARVTHSGKPKPLVFDAHKARFAGYNIVHVIVDDMPGGDDAWTRERFQRNAIDRGLQQLHLQDGDRILISDVDEIPRRELLRLPVPPGLYCLEMQMYYFNVCTRAEQPWYAASLVFWELYNDNPRPQQYRQAGTVAIRNAGWHFSYFGTPEFISNKIQMFAHQEFNSQQYTDYAAIATRMANGADLFDRPYVRFQKVPEQPQSLPPGYEQLGKQQLV